MEATHPYSKIRNTHPNPDHNNQRIYRYQSFTKVGRSLNDTHQIKDKDIK